MDAVGMSWYVAPHVRDVPQCAHGGQIDLAMLSITVVKFALHAKRLNRVFREDEVQMPKYVTYAIAIVVIALCCVIGIGCYMGVNSGSSNKTQDTTIGTPGPNKVLVDTTDGRQAWVDRRDIGE